MKPLESALEKAVCNWADAHGILHTKLNLQGRRGWPDRAFWTLGGRPILLEFKRKGEMPTKLQLYVIKQLRKLNYVVEWFDNAEEAIAELNVWVNRSFS